MKCRFCGTDVDCVFVDLVNAPASNSLLNEADLNSPETFYPLKVMVCENCWLAQIEEYKKSDEIFSDDYVYYSSYSSTWVEHAKAYVKMISERLGLTPSSRVLEIASNDGYLLQFFVEKKIPCLGVEPSAGTAQAAQEKGVPSLVEFFGKISAENIVAQYGRQNLVIGNNVLAHVPDINDFIAGLAVVLAEDGTVTMEFPHLLRLIQEVQFDTIYHEHYSYLSLLTVQSIFAAHGLMVYDVEKLPTHGGSLRIYACHEKNDQFRVSENVSDTINEEEKAGLFSRRTYLNFQNQVNSLRDDFLLFLLKEKKKGKRVAAYGAAAKGNTFLNYCGIKGTHLISFVVDASPHKEGKFLPGSHIPIVSEDKICEEKPDIIVILPWNLKEEITDQLSYTKDWGCEFVLGIPELKEFKL
ncbi:MAG: methyltransferase domain-containing protein [Methanogenium sp.]|nr:methyltransferase domain-containing protein [Methanogenium sp.]